MVPGNREETTHDIPAIAGVHGTTA